MCAVPLRGLVRDEECHYQRSLSHDTLGKGEGRVQASVSAYVRWKRGKRSDERA